LLYGFSAGGMFTNQFVDWRPGRVAAWCACAGEDEEQSAEPSPPGIIACGEYDGSHYGADLSYFKKGRALGKPWLWISVPKTDHQPTARVEAFTRQYFKAVLDGKQQACWIDIDYKTQITFEEAARIPSISAWLPNRQLFQEWSNIHQP
jgi:dienelactone hydrolase